jgi:ribosomal-protein-alanine N-acetyltransferase
VHPRSQSVYRSLRMNDSTPHAPARAGSPGTSLLCTDRLDLRPIRADDRAALVRLLGDPEVARYLGDGGPLEPAGVDRWLDAARRSDDEPHGGLRAVVRRDTGQMIGYCGIADGEDTGRPELMYAFVPSCWGKGFATEAAQAVLAHVDRLADAFDDLLATADPANTASLRLLTGLGFVETHRAPDVHGLDTVFLRRSRRS